MDTESATNLEGAMQSGTLELVAAAPDREAARLAALQRYAILDTPPDGSFDRIAAIAAKLFDVPIAIVSLVDHDRIWFKARHGIDVEQIGRDPGLCASAILQDIPYVLTDASCDPRSLSNPLVAGEFGLRFYVAAPLRTSDGYNLGTLCVIDQSSRAITESQIAQLEALAAVVVDQMELRLAARNAVADLERVVDQKDAALARSKMLAKEIDHRVMNSLQQVSALLNLQSRDLGECEEARQLQLAAGRVSAVARVHQHIFQTDQAQSSGCRRYLERLCHDISGIMGREGRIVVDGIDAELPVEMVPPIGLAVNELVTNAYKNGARLVNVTLERDGKDIELSVADDAEGLPADFDPQTTSGLGMKVVRMVARQLAGTFHFGRSDTLGGAKISIRFPDPRAADNG
jgi:two-component sensor histidine kinase